MSQYDIQGGKAIKRKPKLFDDDELKASLPLSGSLKSAANFSGPVEGGKIPFNERDLVSVPEITQASNTAAYGNIISGAAKGLSNAMKQQNELDFAKEEMKDQKRRKLAQLLSGARKRDAGFADLLTDQGDQTRDYQSQAIQDVARGFAETFRR